MAPGIASVLQTAASQTPRKPIVAASGRDGSRRLRAVLAAASCESWFWPGLVLILFCLPLFVGLGRTDLDNDESIYSFAVDVMVQSGDWLTPKSAPREDEPFLEKPPLKIWIVALPIRLGLLPHDEFGLRFWDALFGGAAFLYVFAIGRRLGGPVCGVVAVLTLFIHRPLLFNHGLRSNNMEAALVLSYSAGVYHFLKWRDTANPTASLEPVDKRSGGPAQDREERATASRKDSGSRARSGEGVGTGGRWHIVAIALYFVLAFMTKFVAALFLPMLLGAAALSSAADRQRLRRDWRTVGAAGLLAVVLIAPWFAYAYARFGSEVWSKMVGEHVFKRFTDSLDPNHLKPWYFYWVTISQNLRSSPVVALAVSAGLALILFRTIRRRWVDGGLVLLWFVLPVTLISLGTSKLYHYAYPFLPPLALAAGYLLSVLAPIVWRVVDRPLLGIDTALRRPVPGIGRFPALSIALVCVAGLAAALSGATYAAGDLRLAPFGVLLVRNSNALRPLLIALLALALAGRVGTAIRAVVPLTLLLIVLPVASYGGTLSLLPLERHPLRSLRDCLQPIADGVAAHDGRSPGVWVEHEGPIPHFFYYYLRHLGPWEVRDFPSDATVYVNLFDRRRLRPVLLSDGRFDTFTRRVRAGDADLIAVASRKAGLDPSTLAADASRQVTTSVTFGREVLLLPGPYSVCAATEPIVRSGR